MRARVPAPHTRPRVRYYGPRFMEQKSRMYERREDCVLEQSCSLVGMHMEWFTGTPGVRNCPTESPSSMPRRHIAHSKRAEWVVIYLNRPFEHES